MSSRKRPWNTTEIKRLKALWATTRPYQYAEVFPGRTHWALVLMASKLGLHKKYPKPEKRLHPRKIAIDAHVYKSGYFK
jgi:hypothetical protein